MGWVRRGKGSRGVNRTDDRNFFRRELPTNDPENQVEQQSAGWRVPLSVGECLGFFGFINFLRSFCRSGELGRTTPFHRLQCRCLFSPVSFRIGLLKTAENFVGRILQPGARLVKLTRCLACQLAELVAIGHVRKCPKNKIRTHAYLLLFEKLAAGEPQNRPSMQRGSQYSSRATPNCNFQFLDAFRPHRAQIFQATSHVVKWRPGHIGRAGCGRKRYPDCRRPSRRNAP